MTRWQKFITDFGARYDSNPAVSYVIIAGIGNHDEWDIATRTARYCGTRQYNRRR